MNNIKKKKNNFTYVSNLILRDSRISFKAKGLFCYMFSMDESWNFTVKSIAKQQKDGIDSVLSALRELKTFKYISYTKYSNGTGTYFLDDEPNQENPNQENPNQDNPNLGKSTRIKKEQPTKKEQLIRNNNSKKENIENEEAKDSKKETKENLAVEIIDYLNLKVNKRFGYGKGNLKEILSQISNGATKEQLIHVVDVKANEWLGNQEMKKNLNPVTLFREANFDRYLNQDFQTTGLNISNIKYDEEEEF